MKTPIEPDAIRAGDLVRAERGEHSTEWRVGANWSPPFVNDATYYLLDRPVPPVDLPLAPTLGWVTINPPAGSFPTRTELAAWSLKSSFGKDRAEATGHIVDREWVTAFIPATAVPTSALNELRIKYMDPRNSLAKIVGDFLDAVDAAGDPR